VLRAIASVGTSDADPSAAPQLRQKRLRSGISAEQDGHLAIETHSITRGRPVVAFWTLQVPYHKPLGNRWAPRRGYRYPQIRLLSKDACYPKGVGAHRPKAACSVWLPRVRLFIGG
jgi:hypothetical protein